MLKQIQFRGQDDEGNVFCQPLWGHDYLDGLEKTAASKPSNLHPAVKKYIKGIAPTDKGIYILVNALGSGEYWGSNVNGDLFPEAALIHSPPGWNDLSPEEMKVVGKDWKWGFPSFMNAYPYKHHVNKDPSRAFGEVKVAVWNPKMHRVELVVYIDRALCKKWLAEDVINRIDNGEFPDVSMGCRVPFDICTICDHKSKTRKDYCDHAKLLMNKILPDGRKVAVRNDTPRFFDISFVFIGADKSAKMLAKLAHVESQQCMGDFCTVSHSSVEVGEAFTAPTAVRAQDLAEQWAMQKVADSAPTYEKTSQKAVKRQTTFDGRILKIEVDAGDIRTGVDGKGKKWSKKMKAAYGYIPRTVGKDGETVDIYLAPDPQAGANVYIVRQLKKDGSHDEDKVMLGFSSKKAATVMYLKHIPAKLFGGVTEMTPQAFSSYLRGHEKKASDCGCEGADPLEAAFLVSPGEKSASHAKLCEIIKSIPAGPFRKAMLPKLEKAEGTLPNDVLKQMSKLAFDVAVSTAAMMGIVLKPQEFQRMVLTKIGEEELADTLDEHNQVFAPSVAVNELIKVNEALVDQELKSALLPFVSGRSIAAPALEKRASLVSRLNVRMSEPSPIQGSDPFLSKVAALYNGYRRSLVKKANAVERSLASDPQLMLATAGESMVQAFAGGITKSAGASVLGPESLAYLVGAHYKDREFHAEALAQSGVLAA